MTLALPSKVPYLTFSQQDTDQIAEKKMEELENYFSRHDHRTIVIDPGHGGKDAGCSGKHSREKDIVLEIGKKLGKKLATAYPEMNIIYTRKTDVFIPLHERAKIANRADADLFISIHCNYVSSKSSVQGTETYVMGLHRADDNLAVAKRENSVILMEQDYEHQYKGFDPNADEGHIILSLFQSAYLDQSILFAGLLENNFALKSKRHSRGVKQAGFLVLRNTTMPSVLIETGFLSNPGEEQFLFSHAGQESISESIKIAFDEYVEITWAPSQIVQEEEQDVMEPEKSEPIKDQNLYYRVQFYTSEQPANMNQDQWKKVNDIKIEKNQKVYKYFCGNYTNYRQASEIKIRLHEIGFSDAFVTAYLGGEKLNVKEAIEYESKK